MMYKPSFHPFLAVLLLFSLNLSAQKPSSKVKVQNFIQPEALSFTENKGQLADENGKLLTDIRYYGEQGGVNVYMRPNRLSFVFNKVTEVKEDGKEKEAASKDKGMPDKFKMPAKTNIETSRMDMDFLNANPNPEIMAEGMSEDYTNYYLGHTPESGITQVRAYKKLVYKNLYPHIDLILLSEGKAAKVKDKAGMEYEFLVHPGGKVSDIQIKWSGTKNMEATPDGGIHYTNTLGEMTESQPLSFTGAGNVASSFNLNKNIVSFNVGSYDGNQTLTVDPTLSWGTSISAYIENLGNSHAIDTVGSIFLTGTINTTTGFATSGAYQTSFGGRFRDIFITKYTFAGKRAWATYYGGTWDEYGEAIALDKSGNILISGSGAYSANLATSGAFQTVSNGYWDGIVAKFSGGGFRLWATFFGGPDNDDLGAIVTDIGGNIYVSGTTYSKSLIATTGAFQTQKIYGSYNDAILVKFSPTGSRLWSTYYGDYNYNYGRALSMDSSGNVLMVGSNDWSGMSATGLATSGSYQTNQGDGFMVKFNSSGSRIWGTYLPGPAYSIAFDKSQDILISGEVRFQGYATSGVYQTSFGGGSDAFLARFNNSGGISWFTYFGGYDWDEGTDVSTDTFGNIFICGNTYSSTKIATSTGYQTTFGGVVDGFLAEFSSTGVIQWASYIGGSKIDYCASALCQKQGTVLVVGNDGWSTGYGGSVFVKKFDFSKFKNAGKDRLICPGNYTILGDTAFPGHTYSWTSRPAGFVSTSSKPMVMPAQATTYILVESYGGFTDTDSVVVTMCNPLASPYVTYSGGKGIESANRITKDIFGNIYIVGTTTSDSGIATSGAYKTSFSNISDLFLTKINCQGAIEWSTYFGGAYTDVAGGITTDIYGNILITGNTTSSTDIATDGTYKSTLSGYADAFIAKFNPLGDFVWGTYYGGTDNDYGTGLSTDKSGNIYLTGYTKSTTGIADSTAYQSSIAGGNDIFLAKLDNNGALKWGTYYGGSADENANGVTTDSLGNVFLTGFTASTSGIATSGAFKTSFSGGTADACLAAFGSSGALLWGTYYGGTSDDKAYGIATDKNANILITGFTKSNSGIATSGTYKSTLPGGGSYDCFLTRFSNTGVRQWGTYFGSSGVDQAYGVTTDPDGNAFICGTASSTTNIATSGAYQTAKAGVNSYSDAFVAKFNTSGLRKWASYFGGAEYEQCYSLAADANGGVYLAGLTTSTSGIATSGAYKTSHSGPTGNYDAFFAKLDIPTGCPVATVSGPTTLCANAKATYRATTHSGSSYAWSVSGGTITSGTTNDSVVINWSGAGSASVSMIEANGTCLDTADLTIVLKALPLAKTGSNTSIAYGTSINIGDTVVSGNTYAWTSIPAGFTSTLAMPTVSPISTTTYFLTETNPTGCSKTNSVTITVTYGGITADAGADTAICQGSSINLGISPVTGHNYLWTNANGFSSTLPNPNISPIATTTYYLIESGASGSGRDSVIITVNPLPSVITGSAQAICNGATANIGATAASGNSYAWTSFPSGFASTNSNPTVSPTTTTKYYLTVTNASGCSKTDSVIITVNPKPAAYAGSNKTICSSQSAVLGTTAVSGNTYSWTSSASGYFSNSCSVSVSPTATTTYTLKETTSAGCVDSHSVKITVSTPLAKAGAPRTICSGTATRIGDTAVVGNTYLWSSNPSGYSSSLSNPLVTPTVTTTYSLLEVNGACNVSHSVVVTVNPQPSATMGVAQTLCGTTTLGMGTSAVAGNTYNWTSNRGGFTSSASNPSFIVDSTTIFTLTETTPATGCFRTNTLKLTVTPKPLAVTGANVSLCSLGMVALGSSGIAGNTYSWSSNPAGFSSPMPNVNVMPNMTTTYTLTERVGSNLSCSTTNSVIVSVGMATATVGASKTICTGQVATLGSAPVAGHNYSWVSKPAGFTSSMSYINVSPAVTTKYILTETVGSGCAKSDSVIITVGSPLAKTGPSLTICAGTPTQIGDTAVAGHTYSWTSTNAFTSTLANPTTAPFSSGTYTLQEGNGGCYVSHSMTITVNPIPNANVQGSRNLCGPNNINLGFAAIPGNAYSWRSSRNNIVSTLSDPVVLVDSTTTYTMTETYPSTGCSRSNSETVTVYYKPSANVGPNFMLCPSSTTTIGSSVSTGNIYTWTSNPSGFSATTSSVSISPSATTTYTLVEKLTAMPTCLATKSVVVTVSYPAGGAGNGRQICKGQSTTMGAGQIGLNTYSWTSNPSGFTSTLPNPVVSPTVNTTYTVVETAIGGCTATKNATVFVNPLPTVNAGTNQTISSGSVTIGSTSVTGHTYSWTSNPTGFTSTVSNPSVSPTFTTVYKLTQTISATGCWDTGKVTITHPINFGQGDTLHQMTGIQSVNNPTIIGLSAMPNPFREELNVKYTLAKSTQIHLEITDVLGRQIIPLVDTKQEPGEYTINLISSDNNLKSGIYTIKMKAGEELISLKVVKVE